MDYDSCDDDFDCCNNEEYVYNDEDCGYHEECSASNEGCDMNMVIIMKNMRHRVLIDPMWRLMIRESLLMTSMTLKKNKSNQIPKKLFQKNAGVWPESSGESTGKNILPEKSPSGHRRVYLGIMFRFIDTKDNPIILEEAQNPRPDGTGGRRAAAACVIVLDFSKHITLVSKHVDSWKTMETMAEDMDYLEFQQDIDDIKKSLINRARRHGEILEEITDMLQSYLTAVDFQAATGIHGKV
ncbi:hypothetical protein RND71_030579 [Anisodus tanguticus]|uniref:Uncharacterized protein n=1 Tax=Anisodus tanguticus TaxID=243964 RepID=A0AAE1V5M5_9SOLA|nr:hypothetical protein RND71_030579 [Anisodus tanguticus]